MALSLAYLAVFSALASGFIALGTEWRRARLWRGLSFALLGVAGISAVIAGGWALLTNTTHNAVLPFGLPWMKWHLRLDVLSGFFLVVVGILVTAVSIYAPGYAHAFKGKQQFSVLGLFTGIFVAGMMLVLLADDAFAFMVAWELMSVSSYFLVTHQHQHAANRRAGFLYLLMAHIGALAILLSFGVLSGAGSDFAFSAMRDLPLSPTWASIAFALAFFGFGMKAGMAPVHAWLPEAHPVAPSHISALMSGVMLKVAIYGLIRVTYDLLGDIHWQWGLAVLLLGTASSLLGVLYALMQHNLKRLLAYHSVENIGIILMGLGLSMIFLGNGHTVLGILGLIAALYHTLNHALFKGLLFLGAGAITHACRESDLNNMGGLIRRMPQTALFFLIGCIAISALPPLNGFVSEWLTFQVALQAPALESGVLRSLIPVTAAMLALSGSLAAACFVKVYGVAFLGQPRSRRVSRAREVNLGMRLGMGMLAALCVVFGVFPSTVIGALIAIPGFLLGDTPPYLVAHEWLWLTPVSPDVASYSGPLVFAGILVVAVIGTLLLRRGSLKIRRGYPWDCGFGALNARMQYTATAFTMPIRRVFAPVWDVDETIEETKRSKQALVPDTIRHQLHVYDRSWSRVYEPIGRFVIATARRIGQIQTGSIRTYLMYSFFTLLLLLWVVT